MIQEMSCLGDNAYTAPLTLSILFAITLSISDPLIKYLGVVD